MNDRTQNIAIVGMGPRGLTMLERLVSHIQNSSHPLSYTIHCIDPFSEGGGRIWSPKQSEYFLMNTIAAHITVFIDDSVKCSGEVSSGYTPPLYQWVQDVKKTLNHTQHFSVQNIKEFPKYIQKEICELSPTSYPSRALYGFYQQAMLRTIVERAGLEKDIEIKFHPYTATTLESTCGHLWDLTLDNGTTISDLEAVVLTVGHDDQKLTAQQKYNYDFAQNNNLAYIPPAQPCEVNLDDIYPEDTVIINGLGLTFFDYMIELTAGRGGQFIKTESNSEDSEKKLIYIPHGKEPSIVAGSGSGLPYQALSRYTSELTDSYSPRVFSAQNIISSHQRLNPDTPLNFRTDIWPFISHEVQLAYYSKIIENQQGTEKAEEFIEEYLQNYHICSSPRTFSEKHNDHFPEKLIEKYSILPEQYWNWENIKTPFKNSSDSHPSSATFLEKIKEYLRKDLVAALEGNSSHPYKYAVDILKNIRDELRSLIDFGGIDSCSYQQDIDHWYNQLNAFMTIGPPAERIQQLLALIDAGIVRLVEPGIKVTTVEKTANVPAHFKARSGNSFETVSGRVFIEGRLPAPCLKDTENPLLSNAYTSGLIRMHSIPAATTLRPHDEHFDTKLTQEFYMKGLDVTSDHHLVDVSGNIHHKLFAAGIPTEGTHWFTAVSSRPYTNSTNLRHLDEIASQITP